MPFTLPDLPFAKDALAPHMSAETLDFHHGKHHKTYVDKANALRAEANLPVAPVEQLIETVAMAADRRLFNNLAQAWNHAFYWNCMSPRPVPPGPRLASAIDAAFGGPDGLRAAFVDEGVRHFGSGWVWLAAQDGRLVLFSTHDADTPAVHDLVPLLTLDVWEHAYYIDYRNERPKFLKSVLDNIVNWDFVAKNLDGKGLERADQKHKATADA